MLSSGKLSLTLAEVTVNSGVFDDALLTIINDKVNNLKIGDKKTFGNRVQNMANFLHSHKESEDYKVISFNTTQRIYQLMSKRKNLVADKELQTLTRELHLFSLDQTYHETFRTIIDDIKCNEFQSLFHSLCVNVMTELMKIENKRVCEPYAETKLSSEEQQVLRYTAGYIIFSLRRKYIKLFKSIVAPTREAADAVLEFIDTVSHKHDPELSAETFLEFTQKWIELKNRGGLVETSDEFFIFIRRVEGVVKGILTINFLRRYKNEDMRDILMDSLNRSTGVTKAWDNLTRNLENDTVKSTLKEQILQKWVDIRARSFVLGFIELMKQVNRKRKLKAVDGTKSMSKKAEPALRKTLT